MARTRQWPGDPHRIWAQTTRYEVLDRPAPPRWKEFDDFCRHVSVPGWFGTGATLMFFSTIPAYWAWRRNEDAEPFQAFTVVLVAAAVAMFLTGAVLLIWHRFGRSGYLQRVHRRALERGVAVNVYPTSFRMINNSEGGPPTHPTVLLIDARLPDAVAQKAYTVFTTWCASVFADEEAQSQAKKAVERRAVISLSEILGPEAARVWLAREEKTSSPWRLLLLKPHNVELSDMMPLDIHR